MPFEPPDSSVFYITIKTACQALAAKRLHNCHHLLSLLTQKYAQPAKQEPLYESMLRLTKAATLELQAGKGFNYLEQHFPEYLQYWEKYYLN